MKKFISLFLSLVMLLSIISGLTFNVYAATPTTGKCGENIIWKYNSTSKTLTLSGTGAIDSFTDDDFSNLERPWKNYIHEIEKVKIEEGITSIGDYTFKYIASNEIKNIEIPKSLISIGESAFKECIINQVSYNGTNTEFFKIKNIENNKELIIGKFNPILNELLSKPIEVEYKQSEYLELTDEYLTKKVTDIINNNENAIKNNINVKNGYLYINNISIGELNSNMSVLLLPGEGFFTDPDNYYMSDEVYDDNIESLHHFSTRIYENDYFLFGVGADVIYTNDLSYNADDKQYVDKYIKNLNLENPNYFEIDYDEFKNIRKSKNPWNSLYKITSEYYNKKANDNSIKFIASCGAGGAETSLLNYEYYSQVFLGVFKNDVFYGVYYPKTYHEATGRSYDGIFVPTITLPNSLSDDKIGNYIKDKINNDWQNIKVNSIQKGATYNNSDIKNGYTLNTTESEQLNDSTMNGKAIIIAKRSGDYVSPTPGGDSGNTGGSTGGGGGGFTTAPTPEETYKKDEEKKPETTPSLPATSSTTNKPATVTANKPKAKKSSVVATWKPINNADGYEVQVATDKKFKKNKKSAIINKKNAKKKTIKNLKKNKKYFVRVRAYKIVDGKKVYGKWSKIKSVKTK